MKLKDKIYFSVGLTVFLTIAYYYLYAFTDLYLSKLCDKYICFKFLTYSELLAIWVALISLYFVVSSLDDWKNQYKFEKAIKTIAEFDNIIYVLNFLDSRINNIIIKAKKDNYIGLFSIESDFKEQVANENIYVKLYHLEEIINHEKNNLHQEKFEILFLKFNNLVIKTLSDVDQCHLYESAYGNDYDADHNINRRKEAVKKIENILKKFRFESKEFQKEYRVLKELLHL